MKNIVDMLYKHFEDKDKEYRALHESTELNFAPSYMTKCPRSIYYRKTGVPDSNPIELPARMKMFFGSSLHEVLQNIFKEQGVYESGEELKEIVIDDILYKYRIDGLLNIDNHKCIIEIKTIYGAGFRAIENMPRVDHIMQTLFYMRAEKINDGVILYAGRDNGLLKQYTITIDDLRLLINGVEHSEYIDTYFKYLANLKDLKKSIIDGKIPDRLDGIFMKRYRR